MAHNSRSPYRFLWRVVPHQGRDLEQRCTCLAHLLTKLPRRAGGGALHLEDDVDLQYYWLQKISEGRIDLKAGEARPLKGPKDVGTGQPDDVVRLSELIDVLNQRFGTDFIEKAFEGLVIDRMEGNEEIFGKLMADGDFRQIAVQHLMKRVYDALKPRPPQA